MFKINLFHSTKRKQKRQVELFKMPMMFLMFIWKSKDPSLQHQPTNHISLAALIVGIVVRVPPLSSLAAGHRQLVSSRLSAKIRVVRNVERVFQAAINWLTGAIMDQ